MSRTPQSDAEIVRLRQAGLTLRAIGERFGLTRERVRQILAREGVKYQAPPRQTREEELAKANEARRRRWEACPEARERALKQMRAVSHARHARQKERQDG